MKLEVFDSFIGEKLSPSIAQDIERLLPEGYNIKYLRQGTVHPENDKPGRIIILISQDDTILGFEK